MEGSLAILAILIVIDSVILLPWTNLLVEQLYSHTHTEVCIHIYVYTDVCYTIFYILQTKKNTDNRPKVPVEGWLNEWWLIYIIKYYIFIKKNKVGV